jgi:hypothetical protein
MASIKPHFLRIILVALTLGHTLQLQIESNGDEVNVSIADSDLFVFKVKSYPDTPIVDEAVEVDQVMILKNDTNDNETRSLIKSNSQGASSNSDLSKNFYVVDSLNYQPSLSLIHETEPLENHYEGDLKIEISESDPIYIKPPNGFKPIIYVEKERSPKIKVNNEDKLELTTNLKPAIEKPLPQDLNRSQAWNSFQLYHLLKILEPKPSLSLPDWYQYSSSSPYSPYKMMYFYKPGYHESKPSNGISSRLLGGLNDLASNHWHLSSVAIEKIETEPLIGASVIENSEQRKKTRYPTQTYLMSIKSTNNDHLF